MDTERTETVQHHVSQSAGTQNAAPVLQSAPVQLPAPVSQQWLGDSGTIAYARVSVLQPGGSGDTSVDTVDTEPHLEALTQHAAWRLAIPSAPTAAEANVVMDSGSGITQHAAWRLAIPSAPTAAEANVVMDSGSGITATSEELVEALRRQPGMILTALTQAFVGHARVATSLGQECDIMTQFCPLPIDRNTVGTSPVYDAVHRAPGGGRCGYHRPEDLERETWDRCHYPTQGIGAESTRA